jgi:hypothetical protein
MDKPTMYFYDIQTIWASDGELHMEGTNGTVTFNMHTMLDDLPIITEYCLKNIDQRKGHIFEAIDKLKNK